MIRATRVLVLFATCLSLNGKDCLSATVITIPATADGDIHTGTTNIENALDLVNVSLNRVCIFEFDLAAQIPAGSTILSAKLRGFSEQVANNPNVDLIGYEATSPAAITLADATVAGANLLSVSDPSQDSDFAYLLPDISSLQSALDGSGVLGLRLERTSSLGTWRIRSIESLGPYPRLDIEFVPEPPTFALAALGILSVFAYGRRKMRQSAGVSALRAHPELATAASVE